MKTLIDILCIRVC